MAEMTPMMKQYLRIKEKYKNEILFFRLGDFYEMFFDDAVTASRELELTLTGKDCGMPERAPMCGIPFHSCEGYIARLIAKGFKVAICEQMEDPALATGLVKRDIIRVITPGTVIEGAMLEEGKNNYLASIYVKGGKAGICFCDISTGGTHVTQIETGTLGPSVTEQLCRYMPKEAVLNRDACSLAEVVSFLKEKAGCTLNTADDSQYEDAEKTVMEKYGARSLQELGFSDPVGEEAVCALCAMIRYLKVTQITGLERLQSIDVYTDEQFMRLDVFTRRNLELCETMRSKEKRGTLLWVLDKTKTAMGKRLIRSWIEQPLLNCARIMKRQNAVSELKEDSILRSRVADGLDGVFDLERLMTRIVYGTASPRDLRSLSQTIERLPQIKASVQSCSSGLLNAVYKEIDTLDDLYELVNGAIVDDPPVSVREGGIIREGYNKEVDDLRSAMTDGKGFLAKIEADEREKTGIKNLKIGYNRVFGYYIEVTNSSISQIPETYIRKQTLTNCERYITQELKDLESRVLGAQEKVVQLEFHLFDEIRKHVASQLGRVQSTAQAVAKLDVLCSFAETAAAGNYCCPDLSADGKIIIKDGRHPVVESILSDVPFVPNDTELDMSDNSTIIITGPNMAGKSTYMRQVALIVLMAQIGSFVPALSARIGIVDSIFTRVGASDDLASGQSTFMVEMSEVAYILKNATPKSLLIFDEIGRGTSTFDGMSIARAVIEYVSDRRRLGAKTLFATHYHELTELEDLLPGVKNYNVAVKKHGDDVTFLRRIIRGGADDSYGIEVAKLAGVPEQVVSRAKEILRDLEAGQPVSMRRRTVRETKPRENDQISIIDPKSESVMGKLRSIDANNLTPIEAMNILFELCHIAQN